MKKWTIIVLVLVVGLTALPLVLRAGKGGFGGTDNKAQAAITQVDPGYRPWFSSIWKPPSPGIESLLFAVQAALGAGVVAFVLGFFVGRAKGRAGARPEAKAGG